MNTNQIIHERLMGKCWHRPDWHRKKVSHLDNDTAAHGGKWLCVGCDQRFANYEPEAQNPKYDSDLNLAFAAQAKAIERFGDETFGKAVFSLMLESRRPPTWASIKELNEWVTLFANLRAKERCAAIVKLLENEK